MPRAALQVMVSHRYVSSFVVNKCSISDGMGIFEVMKAH